MSAPSEEWGEESWLRRRLDQPHVFAWASIGALVLISWLLLAVMAVGETLSSGSYLAGIIDAICSVDDNGWTAREFWLAVAMWLAMTCAMMLPAGAPMLATYFDISGAAERKGMRIPGAHVLVSGYLLVWAGFACIAALGQWALLNVEVLSPTLRLASPWVAGAVLIGAGAWQFSTTKHACLTKCRRPFTWFMANWRDDFRGVFQMGLKQGVICVGCCWALMLVMFVTGLMNLFWMAGLAVVMVAEKTIPNPKPLVYGTGVVLIVAGFAMFAGLVPVAR
ncbi:MAG: DUF2182 domain-containing protein [Hyphomicrobiales bacterium]